MVYTEADVDLANEHVQALINEIRRLKEALRDIRDIASSTINDPYGSLTINAEEVLLIANKGLKE